jgi:cytoskeleton protein RodZ
VGYSPLAASSSPAPFENVKRVDLSFSDASWVDLRDADGQRLLYEHVNQGRSISLEGNPPFSVFLGNAEGVRIEYDGEPFDFSGHTRGVYARFTLGTSAR